MRERFKNYYLKFIQTYTTTKTLVCAQEEMPATLEQTTVDSSIVDVTCERSEGHCASSSSTHLRSASGSSEGSQPSSPVETSEKKRITRVSSSALRFACAS